MKIYELYYKQILPTTLDEAWKFFSNPANLEQLTPPDVNFKTVSQRDKVMQNGSIVTYVIRPLFNIPMQWVTEIKQLVKPYQFIDEQRFGPYRFWHHRHTFKEVENGVEIGDLIYYALPTPIFGDLVHKLIVYPQLCKIFEYRRKTLTKIFC